ncbi:hypothetical protein MANES_13G082434v8 [Manihot esculenta]|uniref:Uncharacterized protein n=1 Tax=Manihot esculenta TaxID=3983 RepID=A0ACB7GLM1_MANES|nr:hypothetical protein MANES_13G082434v8 [Manihot esculenta]
MFRHQTIITVKNCDTAFQLLFYITNCTYLHANFRSFDKLSKLFILGTFVCFYPKL